jgi:glycine/D-amino acid oxidase-like deaminating enzyme
MPRPNQSPWHEGLAQARERAVLEADTEAGVAIVGGGIAGIATAYFTLRDTSETVALLEGGRVAGGASGHNAGQLATYFERPLGALADAFGEGPALAAQREIDGSWALLDAMLADAAPDLPVQRFLGHMGMWSENHLAVHLRSNQLRQRAGLAVERCVVSERGVLGALEQEYGDLFEVVPHAHVEELLETRGGRYRAVLSFTKGTVNSVWMCERVVAHLLLRFPGRFRLFEGSRVGRVELDARGATLSVGGARVRAGRVVLCTNGYQHHDVVNRAGAPIDTALQQRVHGTVGYMAAFFEPRKLAPAAISYLASPRIGEGQAYFYVTRRPFHYEGRPGTLVCIGGPDQDLAHWGRYDAAQGIEAGVVDQLDGFIRPILAPWRSAPFDYPWAWHGLMGYTRDGVRRIGAEPRNPVLLYNLGCNGVGLLPSICGGARVARLLAGDALPASVFDPT